MGRSFYSYVRELPARLPAWHHACALAFVLPLLFAGETEAATYHVGVGGNDANSCASAQSESSGSQKRTIAAGVACLSAGDTLLIHGGTYTGRLNVIDSQAFTVRSGTAASAITIAGASGETVVIQPPDGTGAIRLTDGAPGYLVLQDFVIDMRNSTRAAADGGPDGIYLNSGAHHNRFVRVEVKNNSGNGIAFSNWGGNSSFNQVINCHIHHNGQNSTFDHGQGPGVNNGYGLYVFTSDNVFDGNDIHDNGGYGMHLYNNTGPNDVARNMVRNNRFHGNGTHGGITFGLVVAWGADNVVANNLIYDNRGGGIQVYTGSSNAAVYNNTIYGNAADGVALQYYSAAPIVQNNIVFANGAPIRDYGGTASSHRPQPDQQPGLHERECRRLCLAARQRRARRRRHYFSGDERLRACAPASRRRLRCGRVRDSRSGQSAPSAHQPADLRSVDDRSATHDRRASFAIAVAGVVNAQLLGGRYCRPALVDRLGRIGRDLKIRTVMIGIAPRLVVWMIRHELDDL